MTVQTFSNIGVSTRNGITRVRFCNGGDARAVVLAKAGHDDITFLDLPSEMTKPEAVAFMVERKADFESLADRIAIDEAADRYNPTAVVKASSAKVSCQRQRHRPG